MKNYFELLNLQVTYDVDLKNLEKQYFAMQRQYHPDKSKNDGDRSQNIHISTELNMAYATLKDELKRAEYMLSLHGISLSDHVVRNQLSSAELSAFWQEMECIEGVSELWLLEKTNDKYKGVYHDEVKNLSEIFNQGDMSEASKTIIKLKYIKSLLYSLQKKIRLCK